MGDLLRALLDSVSSTQTPSPADHSQREHIVDVAAGMISTVGWKRLTMSDIAKRGRVGRATLYRYFSTKDELREAIVMHELQKFIEGSTAVRLAAANPEEALIGGLGFAVTYLRDSPLLTRLRDTEPEMLLESLTTETILTIGREFSAHMWKVQIYGDAEIDDEQKKHLLTVSEILCRLVISLAMTPQTIAGIDEPEGTRSFVRRYLLPMLNGQSD